MNGYVIVNKSNIAAWHYEPWSVVVAAAEGGQDGLRLSPTAPMFRPTLKKDSPNDPTTFAPGWDDWDEIAFLYEGGHGWPKDKTLLFKQNF